MTKVNHRDKELMSWNADWDEKDALNFLDLHGIYLKNICKFIYSFVLRFFWGWCHVSNELKIYSHYLFLSSNTQYFWRQISIRQIQIYVTRGSLIKLSWNVWLHYMVYWPNIVWRTKKRRVIKYLNKICRLFCAVNAFFAWSIYLFNFIKITWVI